MKRIALCIAVLAACALAHGPAAASDLFLQFAGIKGGSQDEKHKDWIDVLSYSWGATQSGSFQFGGGGGAGKVQFQDFNFTKFVDKSTPPLFLSLASGKHITEAIFDVVKSPSDPGPFLQYKFTDVLISSYQVGGTNETFPTESVSFDFAKLEMKFFPQDDSGRFLPPITATWDLKKNTGNLNIALAPVPEPSTWAMLIAGLAFVAFRGRKMVRSRAA